MASFGLTLANRGVVIGIVKAGDLLELAQEAEASGAFDAVWVGDRLLAKPRLESLTLLGALAGATKRLRLAVADRRAALEESKAFLDRYYSSSFSPAFVEGWTAAGTPKQCIAELGAYFEAGLGHIALRLTSWDQRGQLACLLAEVAPAFSIHAPGH